jgi:hypothetical protein
MENSLVQNLELTCSCYREGGVTLIMVAQARMDSTLGGFSYQVVPH